MCDSAGTAYPRGMDDDIIAHIRSRIDRCRRLARATTDAKAAEVLNQIAEEGEADLARLTAEREAGASPAQDGPECPVIRIV